MSELIFPDLIFNLIVIGVSFLFLNWASNTVITYAIKVSAISKLGKTSVGFTLIALSTTLPELTVAIIAATSGGAPLSIGNVLGSNIFNISVIIGLATLLLALKKFFFKTNNSNGTNIIPSFAKSELSSIEFGLFISSIVPLMLIYVSTQAAWAVGLILLIIFVGYMYKLSKVRMPAEEVEVSSEKKNKLKRYVFFAIIGALGVVVSANFLVNSAIGIAQSMGISQQVIGATIIAVGTSLPELTIGLKSILKGHPNLAVGNIIGASFFNTTLILGITFFVPALIGTPLALNMQVFQNLMIFSIMTNLFFWYFLSRERISWRGGTIFLFIYALFIITTIGTI